jgi:hypothetical protein
VLSCGVRRGLPLLVAAGIAPFLSLCYPFRMTENNLPEGSAVPTLTALAEKHGTDKWAVRRGGYPGHYYTPHYDVHFSPLRGKPVTLLEIGVGGYADPNKGGQSLRMWKDYFPYGHIFGLDLYDKSALQEDRITIFQASQVDKAALDRIVDEIGGIDIIIDDGSHLNTHVIETFKLLFPCLKSRHLCRGRLADRIPGRLGRR